MSERLSDTQLLRLTLTDITEEGGVETHPDIDTMMAYHEGRLSAEHDERLQAHFAVCVECTRQLLDVEPLVAADETPGSPASHSQRAAWAAFEKELQKDQSRARPAARFTGWLQTVAAALLVSTLGLGMWTARLASNVRFLRQSLAEQSVPRANPVVLYLGDTSRNETEAATAIAFSDGQESALLIITPASSMQFPIYEVELVNAEGSTEWSSRELVLTDFGTLRLLLPRGDRAGAGYRLRIQGIRGDERQTVFDTAVGFQ